MAGVQASGRRIPGAAVSIGAGALLIVAALVFGTAPLLVAGVGFAALGALAEVIVALAAIGVRVERELACEQTVEQTPLQALITVRSGPLGLPGAQLLEPLAGAEISVSLPPSALHLRRQQRVRLQATFARRGSHLIPPPTLRLSDPLGLAWRQRRAARGDRVLVLPRTEPVVLHARAGALRQLLQVDGSAEDPPAAVEPDGLRPYRAGTPATRIHWAAVARGAGLLERRLRADTERTPLVVLDPRDDGHTEMLDAAVRAAASITLWLARQGGCRLLLGDDRRASVIGADLRAWPDVHARLALVQGGERAPAPRLAEVRASGPVFYVSARAIPRPAAGLAAVGAGRCALVAPEPLSGKVGAPAAFSVAGCCGHLWSAEHGCGAVGGAA